MSYTFAHRSQRTTLRDILAQGNEEKKETTLVKVSDRPANFTVPPLPVIKEISEEELKIMLRGIPAMNTFLETPRLPGQQGATGKRVNYTYPMINVPYSRPLHDILLNLPSFAEKSSILDSINSHISTNNTTKAMLVRMKDRLPNSEPVIKQSPSGFLYIQDHMLFDKNIMLDRVRDYSKNLDWFSNELMDRYPDNYEYIAKADAGMPFMATDRNAKCGDKAITIKAMSLAERYLSLASRDIRDLGNYFKEHPLEILAMLKRKSEVIPVSDIDKKVRPYVVLPYAMKMLFKIVTSFYKDALIPFFVNPESYSAIGFSWAYGGADKLVKWIMTDFPSNRTMFRAIGFGDDSLWVITFKDGTIALLAPDVSGMDLALSKLFGVMPCNTVMQICNENNVAVSSACTNIMKFHVSASFNSPVLVRGSVCVKKIWGMLSGVPATTIFDLYGGAYAAGIAKYYFEKLDTYDSTKFNDTLHLAVRMIKEKTGMTMKESTLGVELLKPGFDKINTVFLSMRLEYQHHSTHPGNQNVWTPIPCDIKGFFVRSIWPKYAAPKGSILNQAYGRVFGQYISGGYTDGDFVQYAMAVEKDFKSKAFARIECHDDTTFLGVDLEDVLAVTNNCFPRPEVVNLLYTSTPERFVEACKGILPQKTVPSVSSSEESVAIVDLDVDFSDLYLPLSFGTKAPIKSKQVGGQLPMPEEEKQRLKALRQEARNVRSKKKKNQYRKVETIEEESPTMSQASNDYIDSLELKYEEIIDREEEEALQRAERAQRENYEDRDEGFGSVRFHTTESEDDEDY